ncbi:hypothetical protein ACFV2I_36220 [Streptomyces microflavus]|uniref:hypothetical protein n=1 Tax=Streptomyces microflavus TaxID=1919 RepID=UPI0036759EBB
MPDETSASAIDFEAVPGAEGGLQRTAVDNIPMTEIRSQEVGTFSVRYVDGRPQLVVTGGTVIPPVLTVLDGSGSVVAEYTTSRSRSRSYDILEAGIGLADFEDVAE